MADIRLIKTNKGGKGNVYAYVEFATSKGVEKALKLDRSMLNGRPMFVSPFKDKRSGDPPSSGSNKVGVVEEEGGGCDGIRSVSVWGDNANYCWYYWLINASTNG